MEKPLWMWGIFLGIIFILLILDLGLFNKKDHVIQTKESLYLSSFYISIGLLFGAWVWYIAGAQSGKEYITGFLIEKTLSLDNIFVISLIFSTLKIPRLYQHRVLFWGIVGVIILRGIMIGLGSALVQQFSGVLYVFALFLIYTGFKMFSSQDKPKDINELWLMRFCKKHLPLTQELHGHHFFIKIKNPSKPKQFSISFTPLFLSLIIVEFVDIIFAIDSVPAIFSITTDTYIIYTSNIFAILGLRALYFALDNLIERFIYLKPALAIILIFIGAKIFLADLLGIEKFPAGISLIVTAGLIATGILLSLYKARKA